MYLARCASSTRTRGALPGFFTMTREVAPEATYALLTGGHHRLAIGQQLRRQMVDSPASRSGCGQHVHRTAVFGHAPDARV